MPASVAEGPALAASRSADLLFARLDVGVGTQAQGVTQRDVVETMDCLVGMDGDAKRNDLAFGERQIAFAAAQLAGEGYGAPSAPGGL